MRPGVSGQSKVIVKKTRFTSECALPIVQASKNILQNTKDSVKIIGLDDQEIHAEEIIVAPDGGWGWVIVLGSFVSNVMVDGIVFSFGIISEKIKQTILKEENSNTKESEIAWVLSLLTAFYCLAGPIGSVLANKYGFRVVATIGSGIASSSFALTYLNSRYTVNLTAMYIFCGVMGGTGLSLLFTPSVLAVGFYFEKHRALATSWRITLLIEAGILLACSICTATYRPLRPKFIKPTTTVKPKGEIFLFTKNSAGDNQEVGETLPQTRDSANDKANDGDAQKLMFGHSVLATNIETGVLEIRPEADVESINKPLNRADIYYTGSLKQIPAYADTVGSGHLSRHAWSAAVTRPHSIRIPAKNTGLQCCVRKLQDFSNLMDFTLLTQPAVALYLSACFVVSLGFFAPYTYLIGLAKENGLKESDASVFISVIGASNTVGRIACGLFADMKIIHPLLTDGFSLLLCGTATTIVPFLHDYWLFFAYSVLFGFAIAFHVSLLTINLVEIVGLDHLTSAFGLLILVQGLAFLFGNPLSGVMFDMTGNYNYTFWIMGSLMTLADISKIWIQVILNLFEPQSMRELFNEPGSKIIFG
ncbi:unnamed protein product [Allacma fusca]|uniref:Monocarboxylate transporter n=1 Tax=Allacma fusca TaxID=39272 RepID=A0A8J2KET3_9HEXA|nr:unnamed protein product [Allacma fusca]